MAPLLVVLVLFLYAVYFVGLLGAVIYANDPEQRKWTVVLSLFSRLAWLPSLAFVLIGYAQPLAELKAIWLSLGYSGLGAYFLIVFATPIFMGQKSQTDHRNGGSR